MNRLEPQVIILAVNDEVGFHTRTAALFARTASAYASSVRVRFGEKPEVNGKSMLGLMSLGVKSGGMVRVTAEGGDAKELLTALRELVEAGFTPKE